MRYLASVSQNTNLVKSQNNIPNFIHALTHRHRGKGYRTKLAIIFTLSIASFANAQAAEDVNIGSDFPLGEIHKVSDIDYGVTGNGCDSLPSTIHVDFGVRYNTLDTSQLYVHVEGTSSGRNYIRGQQIADNTSDNRIKVRDIHGNAGICVPYIAAIFGGTVDFGESNARQLVKDMGGALKEGRRLILGGKPSKTPLFKFALKLKDRALMVIDFAVSYSDQVAVIQNLMLIDRRQPEKAPVDKKEVESLASVNDELLEELQDQIIEVTSNKDISVEQQKDKCSITQKFRIYDVDSGRKLDVGSVLTRHVTPGQLIELRTKVYSKDDIRNCLKKDVEHIKIDWEVQVDNGGWKNVVDHYTKKEGDKIRVRNLVKDDHSEFIIASVPYGIGGKTIKYRVIFDDDDVIRDGDRQREKSERVTIRFRDPGSRPYQHSNGTWQPVRFDNSGSHSKYHTISAPETEHILNNYFEWRLEGHMSTGNAGIFASPGIGRIPVNTCYLPSSNPHQVTHVFHPDPAELKRRCGNNPIGTIGWVFEKPISGKTTPLWAQYLNGTYLLADTADQLSHKFNHGYATFTQPVGYMPLTHWSEPVAPIDPHRADDDVIKDAVYDDQNQEEPEEDEQPDSTDPFAGLRLVTTHDKAYQSNGSPANEFDAWVIDEHGNSQWCSDSRRKQLIAAGMELEIVDWSVIGGRESATLVDWDNVPDNSTDEQPDSTDPFAGLRLVTTHDKAYQSNGSPANEFDAWVIDEHGNSQWCSDSRRKQLIVAGMELEIVDWSVIGGRESATLVDWDNVPDNSTDEQPDSTDPFAGLRLVTTHDKAYQSNGSPANEFDAWAIDEHGNSQWCSDSRRKQLIAAGMELEIVDWSVIGGRESATLVDWNQI